MTKEKDRKIVRLITDSSFRKWCLGRASQEEKEYWQAWIAESIDHQQEAITAKRIVVELEKHQPFVSEDKKYRDWQKLSRKVQMAQHSSDSHSGSRNSTRSSLGWITTAAASILLLMASFLTLEYTDLIEITDPETVEKPAPELQTSTTDYGERKLITLDSGTKITLNANSSVTYHDGWIYRDTVTVALEGEAYFDVVPRAVDDGPVFKVETTDGSIHVLGTRFGVNTWDEHTKVVLEEGKVAVNKDADTYQKNGNKAMLKPNEMAQFSTSMADITIRKVNPKIFTSWKEGLFVFERAPLTAVAKRIEMIFGKEVLIEDFELMNERVSGAVENDDLEVLLSALSKTLQITVVEQEDQIILKNAGFEGTFYKQNTKQTGS